MRYYVIAGEASGDLHGSNLLRELRKEDSTAEIRFWGGDLMADVVGETPVVHYRDMAFMGFVEVIKNLRTILSFFRKAKADIKSWQPDKVILIDYPGFNLRMAKWLHHHAVPVVYYITPQVWAWHKSRIRQISDYTDQRLVILPFEQAFFASEGVEVDFVGHPLVDAIDQWSPNPDFAMRHNVTKPVLSLLPGSRTQEIKLLLPVMLDAVDHLADDYDIIIAQSPAKDKELYQGIIGERSVKLIAGATYDILHLAKVALVTSGTATLETAIHQVPQVVCYKGSTLNYEIGRRLIDLKYISLVNLILDKAAIVELIQHDCTSDRLTVELDRIIADSTAIRSDYLELRSLLGGHASRTAAQLIARG